MTSFFIDEPQSLRSDLDAHRKRVAAQGDLPLYLNPYYARFVSKMELREMYPPKSDPWLAAMIAAGKAVIYRPWKDTVPSLPIINDPILRGAAA